MRLPGVITRLGTTFIGSRAKPSTRRCGMLSVIDSTGVQIAYGRTIMDNALSHTLFYAPSPESKNSLSAQINVKGF